MKNTALCLIFGYIFLPKNIYPQEKYPFYPEHNSLSIDNEYFDQNEHANSQNYRKRETLREAWNGATWVENEKYLYGYDENGNEVEYRTQKRDGSGWVDTLLTVSGYENDCNTSTSYFYWNGLQWLNNFRYIYTCDSYGYTSSSLYQNGDSIEWVNNSISTNYRNSSTHFIDSLLYDIWDVTEWKDYLKEIREYSSQMQDSVWTNYIYSGEEWKYFGKYVFNYEASSDITMTYLKWNGTGWDSSYRYLHSYDERGNHTGVTYQNWNEDSWKNSMRFLYEYDQNDNKTFYWYQVYFLPYGWTIISESDFEYDEDNLLVQQTDKSWKDSEATNLFRYTYMYELTPKTATNEIIDNYLFLDNYPNPFKPSTKIIFSITNSTRVSLKIYNIQGKEIFVLVNDERPPGRYEIDFQPENLASGIYFIQLKSGASVTTKKMVLQR